MGDLWETRIAKRQWAWSRGCTRRRNADRLSGAYCGAGCQRSRRPHRSDQEPAQSLAAWDRQLAPVSTSMRVRITVGVALFSARRLSGGGTRGSDRRLVETAWATTFLRRRSLPAALPGDGSPHCKRRAEPARHGGIRRFAGATAACFRAAKKVSLAQSDSQRRPPASPVKSRAFRKAESPIQSAFIWRAARANARRPLQRDRFAVRNPVAN